MEFFLGSIVLLGFNFTPQDFMLCNGQTLPIAQYQALYSLIGTTFGGDGKSNFLLPKLANASPIPGMNYYICVAGLYPQRP